MLFDQKIAIIGGSSGIGLAVAQAAADAGAEVIIGSSSEAKLKGALAAVTERVEGRLIDVTNEESASRRVGTTKSKRGVSRIYRQW